MAEAKILEWECGIFKLWQTVDGKYIAENTVSESTKTISSEFASEAMASSDTNFIDHISLVNFA